MEGIYWGIPAVVPVLCENEILSEDGGKKGAAEEVSVLPGPKAGADGGSTEPARNVLTVTIGGADGESGLPDAEISYPAAPKTASDIKTAGDGTPRAAGYDGAYTVSLGDNDGGLSAFLESTYDIRGKSGRQFTARGNNPAASDVRNGAQSPATGKQTERGAPARTLIQSDTALEELFGKGTPEQPAVPEYLADAIAAPADTVLPEVSGKGTPEQPAVPEYLADTIAMSADAVLPEASGNEIVEQPTVPGQTADTAVIPPDTTHTGVVITEPTSDGGADEMMTADKPAPDGRPAVEPLTGHHTDGVSGMPADENLLPEFPETAEQAATSRPVHLGSRSFTGKFGSAGEAADLDEAALIGSRLKETVGKTAVFSAGREEEPVLPARGSMANAAKNRELPFSLYLFGNADTGSRHRYDREEDRLEKIRRGAEESRFPEGYLRLSETIKMACVAHNLYHGGNGSFQEDIPWYGVYVRYAIANGIIQENDFTNYNDFATRAETAYIFANSFPRTRFGAVGQPKPDEKAPSGRYGDSVVLLFRAGILTGVDRNGDFHSDELIARAEAAVMIERMAASFGS